MNFIARGENVSEWFFRSIWWTLGHGLFLDMLTVTRKNSWIKIYNFDKKLCQTLFSEIPKKLRAASLKYSIGTDVSTVIEYENCEKVQYDTLNWNTYWYWLVVYCFICFQRSTKFNSCNSIFSETWEQYYVVSASYSFVWTYTFFPIALSVVRHVVIIGMECLVVRIIVCYNDVTSSLRMVLYVSVKNYLKTMIILPFVVCEVILRGRMRRIDLLPFWLKVLFPHSRHPVSILLGVVYLETLYSLSELLFLELCLSVKHV